jgi:hypothetical protein
MRKPIDLGKYGETELESNLLQRRKGNQMTPKHTPGPWTLEGRNIIGLVDSTYTGIPTTPVIAVITSHYHGEAVAKMDARLIACAPELLEALKTALNLTHPEDAIHAEITMIQQAIAKAEGRE